MKRILTILATMFFSLSVYAQSASSPISFLGIPVDGSKTNMINEIKKKGFDLIKTNNGEEVLVGEFNGRMSEIYVATNRNKVFRVMVAYADYVTESQIKINYNNLLQQFQNNEKYVGLEENHLIPDEEDISYEMDIHNKNYDASYWVKPTPTDEVIEELKKATKEMSEEEASLYVVKKYFEMMNGVVWFRIFEDGIDKYNIAIYYDNLLNKSNGEDL